MQLDVGQQSGRNPLAITRSRSASQRFARDFLVVKVKNFAADDLIILVAFAGDQNQIIGARLGDRVIDRFPAVGDLFVRLAGLLNSHFGVRQDLILGLRCADCRK